jgi:hypothetical protein
VITTSLRLGILARAIVATLLGAIVAATALVYRHEAVIAFAGLSAAVGLALSAVGGWTLWSATRSRQLDAARVRRAHLAVRRSGRWILVTLAVGLGLGIITGAGQRSWATFGLFAYGSVIAVAVQTVVGLSLARAVNLVSYGRTLAPGTALATLLSLAQRHRRLAAGSTSSGSDSDPIRTDPAD